MRRGRDMTRHDEAAAHEGHVSRGFGRQIVARQVLALCCMCGVCLRARRRTGEAEAVPLVACQALASPPPCPCVARACTARRLFIVLERSMMAVAWSGGEHREAHRHRHLTLHVLVLKRIHHAEYPAHAPSGFRYTVSLVSLTHVSRYKRSSLPAHKTQL